MTTVLFRHGRKWCKPAPADSARLFSSITGSEIRVLESLHLGLDNQGISNRLGIAIATVKSQVNRMALKAGVKGPGARIRLAVAWAEYSSQYRNCELFGIGKDALSIQGTM
jgi:DNA-binding NarL/FixJ family response regulator